MSKYNVLTQKRREIPLKKNINKLVYKDLSLNSKDKKTP